MYRASKVEKMLASLFQNDLNSINIIPYEQLMGEVRKILADFMYECLYPDVRRYKVSVNQSRIGARRYLDIYTENLFSSALNLSKYHNTGKYPLPHIIFHGTTTKFLHRILEKGINPSMAGQCWSEDKEKKIFLTDSLYAAEYYALNATQKYRGNPMILVLDAKGLGPKLNAGPERFQRDHSTVFDYYTQFWSEEPISPETIAEIIILPKNISLYAIFTQIIDYYSNKPNKNN